MSLPSVCPRHAYQFSLQWLTAMSVEGTIPEYPGISSQMSGGGNGNMCWECGVVLGTGKCESSMKKGPEQTSGPKGESLTLLANDHLDRRVDIAGINVAYGTWIASDKLFYGVVVFKLLGRGTFAGKNQL